MVPRLLLSLLALALVSCASRSLQLEHPSTWKTEDRTKAPRWVVVYSPSHSAALAPLKKERALQGYEVVTLPNADYRTIPNHAERLQLGSREKDCLLLVGNASTLIGAEAFHHRMKGIRSDSRYAMKRDGTTPLFAVGRLPAKSPAQAKRLVARILAFERERTRDKSERHAVLLVGNPMGGPNRMGAADFLVSSLSRSLIKKPHASWKFTGAADVKGHPFEISAEHFPSTFAAKLNQPYGVAAYFGHSNSRTLCPMVPHPGFGRESWDQLSRSSKRGLFLSCGCYCLKNDGAVGYRSVQAPGGPVAFIGATRESYSAIGYLAAKGAVSAMDDTPPETAGEWLLAVQEAIATAPLSRTLFFAFDKVDGSNGKLSLREQRLEHLEMWMLVGDPATRLY